MSERLMIRLSETYLRLKKGFIQPFVKDWEITPEKRTEAFFSQNLFQVTESIKGRLIASEDNEKMIRVDNSEGVFAFADYRQNINEIDLTNLKSGSFGIFRNPLNKLRESLMCAIYLKSKGGVTAFVRLADVSKYDERHNKFVPIQEVVEIADYFGLEYFNNIDLKFRDDSEKLYLIR